MKKYIYYFITFNSYRNKFVETNEEMIEVSQVLIF